MDTPQKVQDLLAIRDSALRKSGHFDYGANVLPLIRHFSALQDWQQRKEFQDAVEYMLTSDNPEWRNYAVTLCIGFVVFRDVP